MRFRRQPSRPQHETIITLIDIILFLLIFFLLVGRFDATSPFELAPPISTNGDGLPAGGVTISIAGDGRLALDGVERELGAIAARLDTLAKRTAKEASTPLLVRINSDAGAPIRHLLRLTTALEGLASVDVVLIVTPPGA